MVVLGTQEVATVVTWSWVRTSMTWRERCSDVLMSRRGRGKNFRNVGDARSSCIGVLAVLSACIPRSPCVLVASSPFKLSPLGVFTASFFRARSHGVCLKQFETNAVAWRSGKFVYVRITFVTRLKKSLRRPRRPHQVSIIFRGRSANAMQERVGVTGALVEVSFFNFQTSATNFFHCFSVSFLPVLYTVVN